MDFNMTKPPKEIDIPLQEYLQNSLDSEPNKESLCRGWEYLRDNITPTLKQVLAKDGYWKQKYNSDQENFIISELKATLNEEQKNQLGSFVYIQRGIRREKEKREAEQKLKTEMEARGFRRIEGTEKELDGVKVSCCMNVSIIGILGSFDERKEIEGKLIYSESHKTLMLLPKRSRTRGYLLRNYAYIKEV